jgi:hypothetical protein
MKYCFPWRGPPEESVKSTGTGRNLILYRNQQAPLRVTFLQSVHAEFTWRQRVLDGASGLRPHVQSRRVPEI